MLLIQVASVFLLLTFASSYTISRDKIPNFPVQSPHGDESSVFLRTRDSKRDVISCPPNYRFDATLLKCVEHAGVKTTHLCPADLRGPAPYHLNCRQFVDCWDGVAYITDCAAHLAYNNRTKQCDYPEDADCCEYV